MEIFGEKMIIRAKILHEKILTNGTPENIDITFFFFFFTIQICKIKFYSKLERRKFPFF